MRRRLPSAPWTDTRWEAGPCVSTKRKNVLAAVVAVVAVVAAVTVVVVAVVAGAIAGRIASLSV